MTLSATSPLGRYTATGRPCFSGVGYHPTSGAENDYQFLNLYLPAEDEFPIPSAGYACVVRINLDDGYTGSSKVANLLSDAEGLAIVEAGMALCDATVSWTTTGGSVTGGGLFWPPTHGQWGIADIAETDVIRIVQRLRDEATTFGVNPNAIGLYGGNNAAATVALWVAMSASLEDSSGSTTQEQQSTVPQSCFAVDPTVWYPGCASTVTQNHLRDATVTSNAAATLADAVTDHDQEASPLYRGSLNKLHEVPCLLLTTDAYHEAESVETDPATGLPITANVISALDDGWHSRVWRHWARRSSSRPLVHAQHSAVWARSTAQRSEADRVVTQSGDALAPLVAAYFRSTLGATYNAQSWPLPYTWDFSVGTTRQAERTEGVTMHRRQTRHGVSPSRMTASTRTWRIGFPRITDAQADQLRDLEVASAGRVTAFDFTPPDAPGTVSVHLVSESVDLQAVQHSQWAYSVELEEAV